MDLGRRSPPLRRVHDAFLKIQADASRLKGQIATFKHLERFTAILLQSTEKQNFLIENHITVYFLVEYFDLTHWQCVLL
jgi:hypothetical protein